MSRPPARLQVRPRAPGRAAVADEPAVRRRRVAAEWAWGGGLFLLTVLAYGALWRAGFIWDDDGHVTPSALRSGSGLFRIWFEPGATQQYYPVLHSLFWLEHRLWGDAALGYHLANLGLHLAAVFLFQRTLRWLEVPGAWLAAALFAVHPVGVETVAWISEQKNTLSAVGYFAAALAYFRFHRERTPGWYVGATVLFALALLSKSVTATLPAALLVVGWWRDGRLDWRRDLGPLLPWFALSGAVATMTVWVERTFIGASGDAFTLSFAERVLIAGRAVWFYVGKLLVPLQLTFIQPRWQLDAGSLAQWLFPVAAVLALGALWWIRGRSRGPLAVGLLFVGTLFPALGFFNVYPFVYSFVADHFQYLASAMLLAGFAAGLTSLARGPGIQAGLSRGLAGAAVLLLAALTWRQAGTFVDEETLWRTTLDRNPDCWMACDHLGKLRLAAGQPAEAAAYFQQALRLNPRDSSAHNSLGLLAFDAGRLDEAIGHFEAAVTARPNGVEARNNLGLALVRSGQSSRAIEELQHVLAMKERYAGAHFNLGLALAQAGRAAEAASHFARAVELEPADPVMQDQLAIVHAQAGRLDAAIAGYERAIALRPDYAAAYLHLADAWLARGATDRAVAGYRRCLELEPGVLAARSNLAHVLLEMGRSDEAMAEFQAALAQAPAHPELNNDYGAVLLRQGRIDEAVARFEAALAARADYAAAHANLGDVLLQRGDSAGAEGHYRQALASDPRNAPLHNRLGLALIVSGRRAAAVAEFEQALAIDPGDAAAQQNLERARTAP
jgi:tetratricopeptide (TPR) repeat protein